MEISVGNSNFEKLELLNFCLTLDAMEIMKIPLTGHYLMPTRLAQYIVAVICYHAVCVYSRGYTMSNSETFPGATMTENGLSFKGAIFQPVIDKCEGCSRVRSFEDQSYCSSYPMPNAKWSMGNCNFATHTKEVATGKQAKVNPLKASKRASKGR